MSRIAEDMRTAMKNNNMTELRELRSLMARISNAEAVPIHSKNTETEVPRRLLSLDDLKAIIEDEESEIQNTLLAINTDNEYTTELRKKLDVVQRYKLKASEEVYDI